MRILIVTPAPPRSRKGNRVTALRWQRLLRELGQAVQLAEEFDGQRCDVMIPLHARKSARSVERFHTLHPDRPLLLTLTGTDLYRDIRTSRPAQRSLELANRLIVLQAHGISYLPAEHQPKARVIYQSVPPLRKRPQPLKNVFEVCVIGHLRPVKDPFRTAMAARRLPDSSKLRVLHLGGALSEQMRQRAEREMQENPRYRWLGDVPRGRTMQLLARSRLLVLTSKVEGGANVVSEAIVAGTPVVSSRISGSRGLLGDDYPGYFPVGDTRALADLLYRAETDARFYADLRRRCRKLTPLFAPARERRTWKQVLAEFRAR